MMTNAFEQKILNVCLDYANLISAGPLVSYSNHMGPTIMDASAQIMMNAYQDIAQVMNVNHHAALHRPLVPIQTSVFVLMTHNVCQDSVFQIIAHLHAS